MEVRKEIQVTGNASELMKFIQELPAKVGALYVYRKYLAVKKTLRKLWTS
jgi:hypothetical protein